jgi:hypothetical protein
MRIRFGTRRDVIVAAILMALFSAAARAALAAPAAATPIVWPQSIAAGGGTIRLYEPQVRAWPNYAQMNGVAAIAVTLPGATTPVYGTLSFSSLASADVPSGMVTLVNPRVDSTNWPTASQTDAASLNAFLKANLRLAGKPLLPLAMVLRSLPPAQRPHTIPLRTNPPVIYVRQSPAVLVVFDGKPTFAPITGTQLTYAVNTNWEIIHDPSLGLYFVHAKSGWYSSPGSSGPFTATVAPASFAAIPATGPLSYVHTALKAPKPTGPVPHVIVSTVPSALIDIAGQPRFTTIAGTQLRYVTNTTSDVFFSLDTTSWYVLLSGRWFSAANLNGPWTFASANLPSDFKKIPEKSPAGRVLVSVPGTTQAFYAASVAQVPRVTTVDPATATLTVIYRSGAPVFAPIPPTSLQYAANTSTDVIKVSATEYLACDHGVWFRASSPVGPWKAASYVPAVIYTIPENSPMYHVTFVHVYNAQGAVATAPTPPPTPRPDQTYHDTPASELSQGDRAAYYYAATTGYINGYAAGWGGYAAGTGYYTPGYGTLWVSNPPTYGNFSDTTYAREQAEANQPRSVTMDAPPVPGHGPRSVPGPDTNVYAADDGVYRFESGTWEKNSAGNNWAAAITPASLNHDRAARLAGYSGTIS